MISPPSISSNKSFAIHIYIYLLNQFLNFLLFARINNFQTVHPRYFSFSTKILDNFQPSIPYLLNFQSFRLIEIRISRSFQCHWLSQLRSKFGLSNRITTCRLQFATGTFILLHAHVRHAVRKHATGFYGEDSKRGR